MKERAVLMIEVEAEHAQVLRDALAQQAAQSPFLLRHVWLFRGEPAMEVYLNTVGTQLTQLISKNFGETAPTCDWHPESDEDRQPIGERCGKPATQVLWWPETMQWSPVCGNPEHRAMDDDAPEHFLFDLHAPEYQPMFGLIDAMHDGDQVVVLTEMGGDEHEVVIQGDRDDRMTLPTEEHERS